MIRGLCFTLCVTLGLLAAQAASAETVLDRLKGGVNVERDQIELLSNDDLTYMHKVGIRAIRVFMWPKMNGQWTYVQPGKPMDPTHNGEVQAIRDFISRAVTHDIAVIVVPFGGSGYKLPKDPEEVAMFVGWMEEFAEFAAFRWDPGWVFIETWNEPLADTPEAWHAIEAQLIAAVRRKAPDFTVIVTPILWSSVEGMLKTVPHKDKKVIYDLHYYLPMEFTAQGLPWMDKYFHQFCNQPYPGTKGYDAARIMADFASAAGWAKRNKVKVVLGEFGVGNLCAAAADKAAWMRDVRKAAQAFGMGWLVWDYTKAFSITEKTEDGFKVRPEFIDALGWTHVARD